MVVYANGFRIALNDDRTEAVLHLTQNAPAYSDTGDMIVTDECVGAFVLPAPVAKALAEKLGAIFDGSAN